VLGDRAAQIPTTFRTAPDLQWKIDADYNARSCDSERKAGGAGTMGNNEKTMRKSHRKQ
jgi:hypothetical protein